MNSSLPTTLPPPQGKQARSFAEDSKTYGCSCTSIVAWTALIMAFAALVLSAIVFFNWTNGSLAAPTTVTLERKIEMLEQRLALAAGQRRIAPLPPAALESSGNDPSLSMVSSPGGGDSSSMGGHSMAFVLTGKPREYVMTDIYAPGKPTLMRLCCLAGQYHVCDGSAGTGNVGLDFMLLGSEGRLLVYANSEVLFGGKCTFSWW
jgi:hypothetical protein